MFCKENLFLKVNQPGYNLRRPAPRPPTPGQQFFFPAQQKLKAKPTLSFQRGSRKASQQTKFSPDTVATLVREISLQIVRSELVLFALTSTQISLNFGH